MTLLQAWFWPDVGTRKNAQHAIDEAFWVMVAVAAFWTVFGLIDIGRNRHMEYYPWLFAEPVLLGASAAGIHFKSRTAAILGFSVYVLEQCYILVTTGKIFSFISLLIILALLQGARGTLAIHRFSPVPEGTPSIEKSFQAFGSKHGDSNASTKQE